MTVSSWFLVTVLILGLSSFDAAHAACNVCQSENGVMCLNQTSFHPCFGDVRPDTSQTFHCLDGFSCTNSPTICFQNGAWPPSCGDRSKCGACNANNVFACTSRTTFALCLGATIPSDIVGDCPVGYGCDYWSANICVPLDKVQEFVCDL